VCASEREGEREKKRKRVSRDLEQIGRKSEDLNLGCKLQTANSRRLWKLGSLCGHEEAEDNTTIGPPSLRKEEKFVDSFSLA